MYTHLRSIPTLLSTYFRDVLFVFLSFVSMAISTHVFCCYPSRVPFFHIAEQHCSVPMTQSRCLEPSLELWDFRGGIVCPRLSKFMKFYHPGMMHDKNPRTKVTD